MPDHVAFRIISAGLWFILTTVTNLQQQNYTTLVLTWSLLLIIAGFGIDPEGAKHFVVPLVVRELSRLPNLSKGSVEEVVDDDVQQINEDNICAITFEEIEEPAIVPCCWRAYEKSALKRWFRVSSNCPNCREKITKIYTKTAGQSSETETMNECQGIISS